MKTQSKIETLRNHTLSPTVAWALQSLFNLR